MMTPLNPLLMNIEREPMPLWQASACSIAGLRRPSWHSVSEEMESLVAELPEVSALSCCATQGRRRKTTSFAASCHTLIAGKEIPSHKVCTLHKNEAEHHTKHPCSRLKPEIGLGLVFSSGFRAG